MLLPKGLCMAILVLLGVVFVLVLNLSQVSLSALHRRELLLTHQRLAHGWNEKAFRIVFATLSLTTSVPTIGGIGWTVLASSSTLSSRSSSFLACWSSTSCISIAVFAGASWSTVRTITSMVAINTAILVDHGAFSIRGKLLLDITMLAIVSRSRSSSLISCLKFFALVTKWAIFGFIGWWAGWALASAWSSCLLTPATAYEAKETRHTLLRPQLIRLIRRVALGLGFNVVESTYELPGRCHLCRSGPLARPSLSSTSSKYSWPSFHLVRPPLLPPYPRFHFLLLLPGPQIQLWWGLLLPWPLGLLLPWRQAIAADLTLLFLVESLKIGMLSRKHSLILVAYDNKT